MYSVIASGISLFLLIIKYLTSEEGKRAEVARQIAIKFDEISVDGDILSEQIFKELSQRSKEDWDTIPIRKHVSEERAPKEDVSVSKE